MHYFVSYTCVVTRDLLPLTLITDCQQRQPQLYANITEHLSAEEQQTIQAAVAQADLIQQQAATTDAAVATTPVNGSR